MIELYNYENTLERKCQNSNYIISTIATRRLYAR